MAKRFLEGCSNSLYFVFRVLIGLVFFLHGLQKAPGIIQGNTSLFSLMGIAGVIEVVGGAMLILGLLSRYVAVIASVEMLVAYFKVHIPGGLNPLLNKGEPALLFFAAFLVIIAFGSRKFAIDNFFKR